MFRKKIDFDLENDLEAPSTSYPLIPRDILENYVYGEQNMQKLISGKKKPKPEKGRSFTHSPSIKTAWRNRFFEVHPPKSISLDISDRATFCFSKKSTPGGNQT